MQAYVSHAVEDRDLALSLTTAIRAVGIAVWSPDDISPGANWALELGKALEQSDVMIILFTKGARHSSWLKQEVQFALTEGNYRGRIVPVLVNLPTFPAGADVPWVLLRFQAIHVQGYPTPDFGPVVTRLAELCNAPA
jgi:hypothetical protein